jgi:hypothetical protein
MRFQKGKPRPKGAGRKPGVPNRITVASKLAMLDAFADLGGVDSLVAWGRRNRTEFYKLWAKTLPRDVSLDFAPSVVVKIVAGMDPMEHV